MTDSPQPSPSPAPPTANELLAHLQAHMPQPQRRWRTGLLLIVGVVIGVMLFTGPSLIGIIAPWLVIAGFIGWAQWNKIRLLGLQHRLRNVRELTLLRRPERAAQQAWQLVPDITRFADFHVQTVMLMATNYMALRAFEPAVTAQEYLIEHLPDEHPVSRIVRLQRLLGLLHEDRLSDADDELRKLERTQLDPIGRALLRVARMYQQIKTNHTRDATSELDEAGDELIEQMQHVGVDGGVGYALAAAAYLAVERRDEAQTWWHRATMLVPGSALTQDAAELKPLLELQPARTLAQAMREDHA